MFKFLVFMGAFLAGASSHAKCGDDLAEHASRAEQRYDSGFVPPAANSPMFFHLHMVHMRQLREGRVVFSRMTLPQTIDWLHAFSYTDAVLVGRAFNSQDTGAITAMRMAQKSQRLVVQGAVARVLEGDDEALDAVYEDLVAISANLSTTIAGHAPVVPLIERLATLSLARGDVARRRALINYLARYGLHAEGEDERLMRHLPEWLDQMSSASNRLALVAKITRTVLGRGGELSDNFMRTMVDAMPVSWDVGADPVRAEDAVEIESAIDSLAALGTSYLSHAQKARLYFIRQVIRP